MLIENFSIIAARKLAKKIKKLMPSSFGYGAFNTRLRSECQLLESKTITKLLSSLLPIVSDSTIFEIDDIIYGGDSDVTAGIFLTSENNVAYLAKECFINFLQVFFDEEKFGRSVEMVFLQLLELVPRETMSNNAISAFGKDILRLVLNMSKYTSEERFLKVMKIIVYKDINWFEKTMECDLNGGFIEMEEFMAPLWLPNFPKTLDFDNMHEKRRALWLSEQSEAILTKLNLDIFENDYPMMTYFKTHKIGKKVHYDWMFIGLLKSYLDKDNNTRMSFCINHLHNYFSSAREDEEKMQRIQDFIRGMCSRDGLKYDWNITDIDDGVKEITKYSKFIVDSLFHLFQEIDKNPLMQLRRHTNYDIGSYLSEDNNCSAYLTFKEETVELVEKYFGSSSYSDDDDDDDDESSHESFCEGQKVSFYNKFMKGLQLLDILHTTWLMMDDVSKFKNIHPGIVTEIFRPSDSPFKQRINEFINDPSKRGRVDWWIPFLLMKCPFLIQSYRRESHMKNLIKLLIGKNIDKASEEMLYMTINTKRYFRSSKRRSRFYKYLPEDPVSDDEDDLDDSEDDDVDDDE